MKRLSKVKPTMSKTKTILHHFIGNNYNNELSPHYRVKSNSFINPKLTLKILHIGIYIQQSIINHGPAFITRKHLFRLRF